MKLTIPNLLSLLRMGLVPVFIIAVVDGDETKALLIFLFTGLTDALDGLIARYFDQQSVLGAYLDPMADKLLLMSAYVVLSVPGQHSGFTIPVWVTILVLARDVLIVMVALVLHLAWGTRRFPPLWIGKVNTVVQVLTIVLVLASGIFVSLLWVAELSVFITAGLAVASGLAYLIRINRLTEERQEAEAG